MDYKATKRNWKSKQQQKTGYSSSIGPKKEDDGREKFKKDVEEAVAKGTSNLTATIARAAARFNGSAFDARRRELAAAYVRRFRGLHLKPHAELQHLARGTSSRPPFSRGATRGARGSTRRGTTPSA